MASPFVGHHPSFVDVLGAAPRLLRLIDAPAHEGPVYASDEHALYVTSTPTPAHESSILRIPLTDDRIPALRGEVTVLVEFTGGANGMTLDRDSALLACVQGNMTKRAAIARVDRRTGEMTTIVDGWGDLPLNSPNDVVLHSDGTIWFTDPSYGHLQGFRPPPRAGDHVYRYEPRTRRLTVVSDEQVKPNGLAFSPDETVLYVGDSGANQEPGSFHPQLPHHVVSYDVVDGRRLINRRLHSVTNPGFPDGLKVDRAGRVYTSALDGVHVHDSDGLLLGQIVVPGAVNFCFGGRECNVLFITTDEAIWAAVLAAAGPAPLSQPRHLASAPPRQGVTA